jgi:hypothetical protein
MIQPTWSGTAFDPSPITTADGESVPSSPFAFGAAPVAGAADGFQRSWFGSTNPFGAANPGGTGGGIYAWVQRIVQQLQGLAASMFGESRAESGPHQQVADATFSSEGDPHLAESGTILGPNGTQTIDNHFDSMAGHGDLLHASDVPGGYRISTTVTQPAANGVTWNRSSTVHANFDRDRVTMNADGSLAITSQGQPVSLASGATITLAGGEQVMRNGDGSVVVTASNGYGGTIATTMRTNGTGVDVSTHAVNIDVGGDIVTGTSQPAPSAAARRVPYAG